MARLSSDSDVAYADEKLLHEKGKAIKWLIRLLYESDIDNWGGYLPPAYCYKDIVLIADPGMESSKYAGLDAWKTKDIVKLYREVKAGTYGKHAEAGDGLDDIIDAMKIRELKGI